MINIETIVVFQKSFSLLLNCCQNWVMQKFHGGVAVGVAVTRDGVFCTASPTGIHKAQFKINRAF